MLLRRPSAAPIECASALIGDLARPHNMSEALAEADAVIHSAGVAQTMSGVPEDDYRLLNTEATIKLARAAERAGVRRFVFLSSIRAQSGSTADSVLHEALEPRPTDAYGRSKLAAEQGLAATNLDWVALRLVLVYGPGVQGNMARLAELARSPYPLPLASLKAKRSLLSLDNLVEAVAKVLDAPAELKRPFIVADPEALTIGEMIMAMRHGLGRRGGLFPVPSPVLKAALQALGHAETYRLFAGSLVADSSALGRGQLAAGYEHPRCACGPHAGAKGPERRMSLHTAAPAPRVSARSRGPCRAIECRKRRDQGAISQRAKRAWARTS